jgi:hypothetical protein
LASINVVDRKLLWGRSGNECALKGCRQTLTMAPADASAVSASSAPVVIGQEAHIVAEDDDGPRGEPAMPVSERNVYANLILLCPTHHILIDKEGGIHFSVRQLHQMKADHEASVAYRLGMRDEREVHARAWKDALLETASASRGRLVSRWTAAGVHPDLAQALADDDSVGAPSRLDRELPGAGLVVLEGDFGSGKSVTAERIHQIAIARALNDELAPSPVYLTAQAVTGPLADVVRAVAGRLGMPHQGGVSLVLDGLDEPGSARARELLDEARSLGLTWKNSLVIATARPGLPLRGVEQQAYPPLSDDEAAALVARLGAPHWTLQSSSPAVRTMLHLPLFVIVAAVRQQAGAEIPRSQGTFLEALAQAALERAHAPNERTWAVLLSLARLTLEAGGLALAGELGSDKAVNLALESRLVVREGRALRFALPVIEQYFAARSVLETGPEGIDFSDLRTLDRWRDSLTLAITAGSWQQVSTLLDILTPLHPGFASWLVTSAVPALAVGSGTNVPGEAECARRLRRTLSVWVGSVGPVGERLGLTDRHGQLRTVGSRVEANRVCVGLRIGDNAGLDTIPLPYGLNPFAGGKAPDGSRWAPFRCGNAPADFAAWPWQWALVWVSKPLESILQARTLPLPDTKPYQDERRWALAKATLNRRGSANHRPIEVGELRETAERLLIQMTERRASFFHSQRHRNRHFRRDELVHLIEALEAGQLAGDDGLYHRSLPEPDVLPSSSGHVSGLYADETLRALAEKVYANAFVIYRDLVDTWFSGFAPTLGLACMLPIALKAKLVPRADSWGGPDFDYQMDPLPPGSSSTASVLIAASREDLKVSWQDLVNEARQRRQLITAFHPGAGAWARPRAAASTLDIYGDTPATAQAYKWLWEDLRELHTVNTPPPIGEY